jgi:predicted Zn-dependent protease
MFYATDLAKAERFEDAKREAAKALELNPSDPLMLYNAACFYARIGERQLATRALKGSIAAGYENFAWIKRDPDFDSVRNEPDYVELMRGK